MKCKQCRSPIDDQLWQTFCSLECEMEHAMAQEEIETTEEEM